MCSIRFINLQTKKRDEEKSIDLKALKRIRVGESGYVAWFRKWSLNGIVDR